MKNVKRVFLEYLLVWTRMIVNEVSLQDYNDSQVYPKGFKKTVHYCENGRGKTV
jgi:hypothetical protein